MPFVKRSTTTAHRQSRYIKSESRKGLKEAYLLKWVSRSIPNWSQILLTFARCAREIPMEFSCTGITIKEHATGFTYISAILLSTDFKKFLASLDILLSSTLIMGRSSPLALLFCTYFRV